MISLPSLTKIGSLIRRNSAVRNRPPIAYPQRDWHRILVVSVVALCVLVATGLAVFWQGRADQRIDVAAKPSEALTTESLDRMLVRYRQLDAEHAVLLAATTTIADPSLPR